ncbi:hypothetical protein [Nostoc sp. TCL240-02]|uniref:hypothetical protein n=1 Tax=Nostoc sp. TCL240-02 TaxID=2572090 RepID=UPI00157F9A40|nr:hypothetical protein [Nostoc sp. TCL240-02]QKQ73890.1 hypothetical protein FBB35_11580 [Nostoc sp. TCL240-02]
MRVVSQGLINNAIRNNSIVSQNYRIVSRNNRIVGQNNRIVSRNNGTVSQNYRIVSRNNRIVTNKISITVPKACIASIREPLHNTTNGTSYHFDNRYKISKRVFYV